MPPTSGDRQAGRADGVTTRQRIRRSASAAAVAHRDLVRRGCQLIERAHEVVERRAGVGLDPQARAMTLAEHGRHTRMEGARRLGELRVRLAGLALGNGRNAFAAS